MVLMIPTYTVICRHNPKKCPVGKRKGWNWLDCNCRKHIQVYDPRIPDAKKRQSLIATKTRSAQDAEILAQAYRDQHNPDKVRAAEAEAKIRAFEATETAQTTTIEKAVAAFLVWKSENPSRAKGAKLSGKAAAMTMKGWRTLLGDVQNGVVKTKGRLFAWLEKQNPRPVLISDLTSVLMDEFRADWGLGSLTANKAYTNLNAFFNYCRDRGKWIKENPLDGSKPPTYEDGNRTAAFSDKQYESILNTLAKRDQTDANRRLLTLVELLRWSGMAIIDAVNFHRSTLVGNELRYRRQKTGVIAKPNLLPDVLNLLRTVVPINGDPDQPFRNIERTITSDTQYWRNEFKQLCADAGIKTVKTGIGTERTPHPHMLRDTFAVNQLTTQYELGQVNRSAIADAMGDSVATFEKSYKPWIDELEQAHSKAQNAIVQAQQAKRDAQRGAK
jgi:integrase